MKIRKIKATPVRIPFTEPEIWSMGQRTMVSAIIVEVVTDSGEIGLGESVPVPDVDIALTASDNLKLNFHRTGNLSSTCPTSP